MRETDDVLLDLALYLWFSQRRSKGDPILGPLLCEKAVEEEGYSRDDVYNVDETGVNWNALPRKSLASKREPTEPGFKVSKERVASMVCANASGTHSLLFLVIDNKMLRCFKNISCIPTLYKAQKSAWIE
ncbi:jerky-like protein [Trichonephila clavipes]|nr:jerky-like protein [Trichonephila clavipes]